MLEVMTTAYIEAIYFTETGDQGQPATTAELHPLTKAQAYFACRQFESAARELRIDLSRWSPIQLGHDLWLTRNGHGVGFWDRPEIYGEQSSRLFTAFAHAMGEHDACFVDDNGEAKDDTM